MKSISRPLVIHEAKGKGQALGENLYKMLERDLPPWAEPKLREGFSGEEDAAGMLTSAAPKEWRGIIAVAAYLLDVPNPGFRRIMSNVWDLNHGWLRHAVAWHLPRDGRGGLHHIRRMFKRAEFSIPFEGEVTIYRGHPVREQAHKGMSWTTDRDCACWFAVRSANAEASPVVLAAKVTASELIYWSDERSEREVIPARPPKFHVESDLADLRAGYERRKTESEISRSKILAKYGRATL